MLRKLRKKKTARKIWIVLAAVVVPAFVLWGSGSLSRSTDKSSYAGTIFGRKISLLEYQDSLEAVKNQAIIQFGDKLGEMQKYLNLETQAWDRLIVLAQARSRRLKARDEEIIKLIQDYPFFKNSRGQFEDKLYSQMLRYAFRTQPRIFEEQTRDNIILSKLFNEVTKEVSLTEEQIKEGYRRENEKVSIYYIAGLPLEFTKDITPTEQDLKDHYAKNAFEFKLPLSFNLEYIKSESEEAIRKVFERLVRRENLDKVAKECNLSVKETGLFGQTDPIPGIGWSQEISKLILKLNIGQYSPALSIDKYYYIIRLKEKKEPHIPELDEIKDKVKEAFILYKSGEIAKEKAEDCLKKLKAAYELNPKGADFAKFAKENGLKYDESDEFNYGSYITGIGASDIFWIICQKLKEDELSQIIAMPSGYYIVKLKSKTHMDEDKFKQEKEKFAKTLLLQKKQEYFSEFVDGLKRKAQLY